MIDSELVYYLQCDKCLAYLKHRWNDEEIQFCSLCDLKETAQKAGWLFMKNDEYYCPECRKKIDK